MQQPDETKQVALSERNLALSEKEQQSIVCSTCHLKFSNLLNYKVHLGTEFHSYNTKRRIAQLEPISEQIFEQKKALLQSACESQASAVMYKCVPCNKSFKSVEQLDQHKRSKKHKKNAKDFGGDESANSSMFKSIPEGSIDHARHEEEPEGGKLQMMEAEEAREKIKKRTTLESLKVCLFCNEEKTGVKKVLDHMRVKHSFFLIDVDCLVDLKGLMTYLAEKVHIGQMCVFCNKIFKDGTACQDHMISKTHCFMNVDDFEVEYEKFYDFSKTYENFVDLKGTVKKSDEGEEPVEEGVIKEVSNEDDDSDEFEDIDGEEEEIDEEEAKRLEESGKTSDFEVIEESKSSSFEVIPENKTESFEEIGKDHKMGVESVSSISKDKESEDTPLKKPETKQEKKSKYEAIQRAIEVKKAELLSTGEIKLAGGKIIGHRDYKYIYRQNYKPVENREAVIINRLALEYRKMNAVDIKTIQLPPSLQQKFQARGKDFSLKTGMQGNMTLQKHLRKSA